MRGGVVSGRRWFLLSMDLSRFAAGAAGPGGEEGWSGAGAGEGKGADWLAGWLAGPLPSARRSACRPRDRLPQQHAVTEGLELALTGPCGFWRSSF